MKVRSQVADLGLDREVRRLGLLLKNTTEGCLAFALYRDVAQREAVVRDLQRRLPLPLYELALSPERRDPVGLLRDLLPEVERRCEAAARSRRASRRALISVYDVERAFPEALGYLNIQREFFAQVRHPVVFWVLEYGLREIADRAPDFWDWRSEVFDFRGPEERTPVLAVDMALAEPFFYRDRGDLERRLSLYQGLLEEQARREHPDEEFVAEMERKTGLAHYYLGEWPKARAHLERALGRCRHRGDRAGVAAAAHTLGVLHEGQGRYPEALALYQESLAIDRELGDRHRQAVTLHHKGTLEERQGRYPEALAHYQESLAIDRELGDRQGEAVTLHQMGVLHQEQGRYPEALALYQKSLDMNRELGDRRGEAQALHQMGTLNEAQGRYPEALALYQKSLGIERMLGYRQGEAQTLHQMGNLQYVQGRYPEALALYHDSLTIDRLLGYRQGLATSLGQMGRLHMAQAELERALAELAEALAILRQLSSPYERLARRDLDELRRAMGSRRFLAALKKLGPEGEECLSLLGETE